MSADLPGYAAAQREWENMEPPDGGPSECSECNGSGYEPTTEDHEDEIQCTNCDGHGWLTADGEPFDPHAAERDAADRADMARDARLCGDAGSQT